MNQSPVIDTAARSSSAPSHDAIAQCARELWTESGKPEGHDEAIWLDAERRLIAARRKPAATAAVAPSSARPHNRPRSR